MSSINNSSRVENETMSTGRESLSFLANIATNPYFSNVLPSSTISSSPVIPTAIPSHFTNNAASSMELPRSASDNMASNTSNLALQHSHLVTTPFQHGTATQTIPSPANYAIATSYFASSQRTDQSNSNTIMGNQFHSGNRNIVPIFQGGIALQHNVAVAHTPSISSSTVGIANITFPSPMTSGSVSFQQALPQHRMFLQTSPLPVGSSFQHASLLQHQIVHQQPQIVAMQHSLQQPNVSSTSQSSIAGTQQLVGQTSEVHLVTTSNSLSIQPQSNHPLVTEMSLQPIQQHPIDLNSQNNQIHNAINNSAIPELGKPSNANCCNSAKSGYAESVLNHNSSHSSIGTHLQNSSSSYASDNNLSSSAGNSVGDKYSTEGVEFSESSSSKSSEQCVVSESNQCSNVFNTIREALSVADNNSDGTQPSNVYSIECPSVDNSRSSPPNATPSNSLPVASSASSLAMPKCNKCQLTCRHCGFDTDFNLVFSRHVVSHFPEKGYQCPLCVSTCPSEDFFKDHLSDHLEGRLPKAPFQKPLSLSSDMKIGSDMLSVTLNEAVNKPAICKSKALLMTAKKIVRVRKKQAICIKESKYKSKNLFAKRPTQSFICNSERNSLNGKKNKSGVVSYTTRINGCKQVFNKINSFSSQHSHLNCTRTAHGFKQRKQNYETANCLNNSSFFQSQEDSSTEIASDEEDWEIYNPIDPITTTNKELSYKNFYAKQPFMQRTVHNFNVARSESELCSNKSMSLPLAELCAQEEATSRLAQNNGISHHSSCCKPCASNTETTIQSGVNNHCDPQARQRVTPSYHQYYSQHQAGLMGVNCASSSRICGSSLHSSEHITVKVDPFDVAPSMLTTQKTCNGSSNFAVNSINHFSVQDSTRQDCSVNQNISDNAITHHGHENKSSFSIERSLRNSDKQTCVDQLSICDSSQDGTSGPCDAVENVVYVASTQTSKYSVNYPISDKTRSLLASSQNAYVWSTSKVRGPIKRNYRTFSRGTCPTRARRGKEISHCHKSVKNGTCIGFARGKQSTIGGSLGAPCSLEDIIDYSVGAGLSMKSTTFQLPIVNLQKHRNNMFQEDSTCHSTDCKQTPSNNGDLTHNSMNNIGQDSISNSSVNSTLSSSCEHKSEMKSLSEASGDSSVTNQCILANNAAKSTSYVCRVCGFETNYRLVLSRHAPSHHKLNGTIK